MCHIFKYLRYSVRNNLFLIIGLFFGVTVSFFALQLLESECELDKKLYSAVRDNGQENEESYEPKINLAGKPLKAQKVPQDFIRPRYYSTELGIREKLFVGVISSPSTFDTFGTSFNQTLYHIVNKVLFFSETNSTQRTPKTIFNGLIQFSDTRLILKPFHMLKYIADTLLNDFDFFYLVNDSTYINGRKLNSMVQSISVSQDVHLGFKLDQESSFCSLASGILLSNSLMRQVISSLDWCVKNAYSESNDANLGRCIVHATDVPCSSKSGSVQYNGHNLINPKMPAERILKDASIVNAVSVWPIQAPQLFYKLHYFFIKMEIDRVESEITKLRHAILNTSVVLPGNRTEQVSWPLGTPPSSRVVNRFDLIRWDYFTEKEVYLKSDFSNVDNLSGADLLDVQGVLNVTIRHLEQKYDGQLIYKKLVNGYRKFDPARGMDYVLDVACKDSVTGHETRIRLEVCKPLGKVEMVPVPYVTENTRVNLVVIATKDNQENVLRFIEQYATICMEKRDKTSLLLILVYEAEHPGKGAKDDVHANVKLAALKKSERFRRDNSKITWLSVKLPSKPLPPPLLSILLLDLAIKKFSPEYLLLLCSVFAELRQDFLNRVRMNTVMEKQIFSPIPFSEFHPLVVYNEDLPRPKELDINKNYGHYDATDTDNLSFYVRDYKSARQLTKGILHIAHTDKDLAVQYKGKDDFSMYQMFSRLPGLHVFRAVEPSLRLRHRQLKCASEDRACFDRRSFNLGSRSQLGKLLLDVKNFQGNHF